MPEVKRKVVDNGEPVWCDGKWSEVYCGDAETVLRRLPSASVQCVITSPPYWGLRDYKCDPSKEIGKEATPYLYVERLVDICRQVKRVLRNDGTFWLNIGDTYTSMNPVEGLGKKEIVSLPWLVAWALQKDGWYLRQDIVWAKRNPMPDSVKDRCVKAHEYVFLLVKQEKYYFDHRAIETDAVDGKGKAAKRSVWTTNIGKYKGAHYAVFPPDLIEPMVLAGTSEHGCCLECGTPYKRVVERKGGEKTGKYEEEHDRDHSFKTSRNGMASASLDKDRSASQTKTVGWAQVCHCREPTVTPCTVLDPFCGSGTIMLVAKQHNRRAIGIELNRDYVNDQIIPRLQATQE